MRHRKSGKHLNRTSSHRKAMFSNMSSSLITHEVIQTTVVKAKELRRHVEPLITLAKNDSVANRRLAFAKLRDRAAVGKLFTELGPRYVDRPGGYTRVLKAGFRKGDSAPIAYIELVGRPRPDLEDETEELAAESVERIESVEDNEVVEETEAAEVAEEPSVDEPSSEAAEESEVDAESTEVEEPEASVDESADDESSEQTQKEEPKT